MKNVAVARGQLGGSKGRAVEDEVVGQKLLDDVPLSAGMKTKLIARRRDAYQGDDAPAFASAPGRPLYPQNVSRHVLKPAADSVGLGFVSFHTFRHTCGSLQFEAGRNVKQVQAWLGHADPSFGLNTYVHLLDEGVGDAEFLDAVTDSDPSRTIQGRERLTGRRCPLSIRGPRL